MSYFVAAQSAVFYFLACTPCNQVLIRHKASKNAKKERQEKARIVMEQPKRYQQPDPFQTNPYWAEEIRMGPSLPKKGRGGDNAKTLSQQRLTAASRDGGASFGGASSFVMSVGSPPGSIAGPRPSTSPTINPMASGHSRVDSTPTVVPENELITSPTLSKTVSVSTAGDWNIKPYQREDEELWGLEPTRPGLKGMDALKHAVTSAGRFVESKLKIDKPVTEEDRYNFYYAPRNPPVNEYHPPVVSSKPAHKDGLRWMLQPPPSAKIMEGKVPVSRSGSLMSVRSKRTVSTIDGGASSLGRLVGEKAFEAKIRRGETPFDCELRSSASLNRTRSRMTTASSARTRSRRTARGNSFSTDSEDSSEEMHRRRRPSNRAVYTPEIDSDDEKEYISKALEAGHHSPAHAAQKPRLPTILSSGGDEKEKLSSASPLNDVTNTIPFKSETGIRDIKAQPFTIPASKTVPLPA
ncbi:hypothetical protein QBC42DRAFT_35563 [Cladorrhinum samala]|uniref:Signal peptide-containing protein n=1 Tax=Cladorrhinum samala TaxID=585594 RepID=A0AAV9HC94_9PEZI|nr:hypothetical protein QBC42DRAFT_35563 [Cladorrhinum samala]